ncbi:OmpA family protein [uncultured Allomuricauda sp.]|uniref:OmpA family protein n=1 Tax=Flagellimonas sp. W118 TaxID=3410791 RepID=UPI0026025B4D|nr:OmpA family protein [uncultured Allomuricauda sp.]
MVQTKKISLALSLFIFGMMAGLSQSKKSKGDTYFFQYDYRNAVVAYESDLANGALTEQQYLNLADSYFKTNNFEKASKAYIELYEKDKLESNHHLNKMLQSISRSSKKERKDAFLTTMSAKFPKEFLENLDFNTQLLNGETLGGNLDFQVFNLTSNSSQLDFSPSFYDNKLLFSSGRILDKKKNGQTGYLNIYEASVLQDGQISSAVPFSGIADSDFHRATPSYSKELKSIFYVMSNTEDGEMAFDENGKNALAIAMQPQSGTLRLLLKDLSTSFYYPFYDHKSGKLYFSADFEDGYGGTDIYFVYTNNGQIMSAPINLGPRINSSGNEIAPFIFENSFYFSSDVFYGLGGMDVYKSNIEGESFSIPVNLGIGINSNEDDFGLVMRNEGDGLLGYFASNRAGGKGQDDLYGFKVDKKPGLRTIALKGKVVKSSRKSDGIEKTTVRLLGDDGTLFAETFSDEEGNYRLEIPWKEHVVLEAGKERFSTLSKQLSQEELEALGSDSYNIELASYNDLVEEKEGQMVVKMKNFFFGRSSTQITPEIETELDKAIEFVKAFPVVQLRIETYTDSRGGSSTNFRLTQGRSDAIKEYLIKKGVPSTNIIYSIGYGEDKILNNCTNGVYCLEMLHKQNQRSLIVVLNDNVLFN